MLGSGEGEDTGEPPPAPPRRRRPRAAQAARAGGSASPTRRCLSTARTGCEAPPRSTAQPANAAVAALASTITNSSRRVTPSLVDMGGKPSHPARSQEERRGKIIQRL